MSGTGDIEDTLPDRSSTPAPGWWRGPVSQSDARFAARQRTMVAVTASFGLLALACVIAGILAWQDIKATAAVTDARQARRAGTLVVEAILSAESEQRGYLLLRDPRYLGRYDGARSEYDQAFAELQQRLPTRPGRAGQIATAARIGHEKFAELDQTIALGKAGEFDAAVTIARSGAGKALMDNLRRTIDDLNTDANFEVEQTTATQTWVNNLLIGAIIVALLAVAGLGVVLLKTVRLHFDLLETRAAGNRQLAATLERQVALRTRELIDVNQRFDAALRSSGVTVMTQDRDLVFTWVSRGIFGRSPDEIIGKPQQEVIPEAPPGAARNLKRSVIETGEAARGDVRVSYDGIDSWYDLTVHPLLDERGDTVGIIAGAVDITRYKEQEARIRLLMRELTHRSKNLLTVIQAIMRQTASNCISIADFEARFAARLHSLAGSHDLLVQEDWQGASMRELVHSQLGHYSDRDDPQIDLVGGPMQIPPDAAQHIGMALHELATNAAKYGALSTPAGRVRISWGMSPGTDGTPMCHLAWEESGGPPVERPSRRGFGRVVIERTVARALHGEVRIDYAPAGLRWNLDFPRNLITGL